MLRVDGQHTILTIDQDQRLVTNKFGDTLKLSRQQDVAIIRQAKQLRIVKGDAAERTDGFRLKVFGNIESLNLLTIVANSRQAHLAVERHGAILQGYHIALALLDWGDQTLGGIDTGLLVVGAIHRQRTPSSKSYS